MIHVTANDLKQNFGRVLQDSQREPVIINRYNREAAVLISMEEYRKLTMAHIDAFETLCDRIGGAAAKKGLTEETLAEILK